MDGNQSGAEKDNSLLFLENNGFYCSPTPRWHIEKLDQLGAKLRIQDGGAHESQPCWKIAHQPEQRIWDQSHRLSWRHKSCKNVMQLQNRYLVSCDPKRS